MSDIRINHDIPRTMTLDGLEYLGRMASTVPEGGTIVEIGPLYGSSTWVLSKNAHPSVKIVSIDTWEPQPWIPKRLPDALPFGIEAFKEYTKDCENVTAIQGWSPAVVSDWDEPIHMFFDDATHGDPGFSENVNFFRKFIVDDGIICGDDFAAGWPDIIRVVYALADKWNTQAEVSGRVWSMINNGGSERTKRVADLVGDWTPHDITVETRSQDGGHWKASPRMWSGPAHQKRHVSAVTLTPADDTKVLVQYQLIDGTESDWFDQGQTFETETPIANMRAMIRGGGGKGRKLDYQLCEITAKGRTQNTAVAANGSWVKKTEDRSPICGVRVVVR